MEDAEFEVGDVVKLKSGGPKMTVVRMVKSGPRCGWFDGEDYQEIVVKNDAIEFAEKDDD